MKIWLQKKALYIFIIKNWSIRIWLILQNGYMHVWKSQNINRILNLNPNKFDGFWYIHHKTLSTSLIVVWIHHKQNVDRRYRRRYLSSVEIWIWTINAFNIGEQSEYKIECMGNMSRRTSNITSAFMNNLYESVKIRRNLINIQINEYVCSY